jgi:hypothetical protein
VSWEEVCRRVRGRSRYNAWRQYVARMRRRRVVECLDQWGQKPGVQTLIALELHCHRSTICRDIQRLGLRGRRAGAGV